VLTVYLKDGARLKVKASLDDFERALREAALIRIQTEDGRTIGIAPSHVSLVEAEHGAASQNGGGSVRPLAPAR
jgi:hypothetical protein